jgi:hypothetical protein
LPVLLALLGGSCMQPEGPHDDPPGGNRTCGTSCGGGNPPAFRFDPPFTGTVELFAASQNPVMDSIPFLSLPLEGADSLRLEKTALDSILESDKLDSILKYTLTDSAREELSDSLLAFNMVFRSGDSAWLIPGIKYQNGGIDSDMVFQVAGLAPVVTFRGRAVLPPDAGEVPKTPATNHLYFAGTPFQARIDSDSSFKLQSIPSEEPVPPLIFQFRVAMQSGGVPNQITLLQTKTPLSEDSTQVIRFDVLVDSIPTKWEPL